MTTIAETAETMLTTALQTAAVIAPTNPKAAAAIALAPLIVKLLAAAEQMQAARSLTPEALASLFVSIGQGIQATHDEWAAMNQAKPAA